MTPPPLGLPDSREADQPRERTSAHDEEDYKAFTSASSELLFVLLPFIVIAITLAHRSEFRTIFFIPEWSIVSAVIVGQSIVKMASSSAGNVAVNKENAVLVISILLVCLLVPVLVTLAIILTSENVSMTMASSQATLFVISGFVFWVASATESVTKSREASRHSKSEAAKTGGSQQHATKPIRQENSDRKS
jgi:hypothetical protein